MKTARFIITYRIGAKTYRITLPGSSCAHVRRAWNRPGATLVSVEECDEHGRVI